MRFFSGAILLAFFFAPRAQAQDTLPGFSALLKANGKVIISWRNNYPAVNQISIQRSEDSLRNFTTLLTVPDPTIPENGFVDGKTFGKKMFYRIFILFGNSRYFFTKSKRAALEIVEPVAKPVSAKQTVAKNTGSKPAVTKPAVEKPATAENPVAEKPAVSKPPPAVSVPEEPKEYTLQKIDNQRIVYLEENMRHKDPVVKGPAKIKSPPTIQVEKILFIKRRDSLIAQISGNMVKRFSDSLVSKTKDTLFFVTADTLLIKPYIPPFVVPKEVYKVSTYVFTSKDGNVNISLADYNRKKYSVKFFEQDNTPVLELKEIKDPTLILDRTNFIHSGWFKFELYEDGKLKEKNKLFIPKEF